MNNTVINQNWNVTWGHSSSCQAKNHTASIFDIAEKKSLKTSNILIFDHI